MLVTLEIKDSKEGRKLLEFLKYLDCVKIRQAHISSSERQLKEVFGIWKGRDITKESLRQKGWRARSDGPV